jgi:outer membrane protein OmpA-like peptidoglycan-associated protein
VALLLAAILVPGCSSPPQPARPSAPKSPAATPSPTKTAGYALEGVAGYFTPSPFRVEIKAVERRPTLSILRMEITATSGKAQKGDFGNGSIPSDFGVFRLLDPVGRRTYQPLREKDENGAAFGTRHTLPGTGFPEDFQPGVTYPVEVYFPPLPATVTTVSVTPMTPMGPWTGIPVTEGAADPVSKDRAGDDHWPVLAPQGEIWSSEGPIEELVETPERTTEQDGSTETLGLRTDVLFAFDKADLGPKAATVLDEVAEETRRRADPAKPPVIIVGHTDSKGDDAYNLNLSMQRAKAVKEYLAAKLGTDYQYKIDGKGESRPIAPNDRPGGGDNPEGRARNRRVEISYTIKQQTPGTSVTEPAATNVRGSTLAPARFRTAPGAAVGSFTREPYQVNVLPAYRDGAYVVLSLDVTAKAFRAPSPQPFSYWHNDFVRPSAYGALTLVDPATKTRYYPVHWGENNIPSLDTGETARAYVYYPAPPDDRTSISLQVADGQVIDNVPIAAPA